MRKLRAVMAAGSMAVAFGVLALVVWDGAAVAAKPRGRPPAEANHAATSRNRPRAHVAAFDNKDAVGSITNLTPYTWQLVEKGGLLTGLDEWAELPATLQPGQQFVYRLHPFNDYATTQQYGGYFTYRADGVNAGSEYLTVGLSGSHCTFICLPRDGPALNVFGYDATSAPDPNQNYLDPNNLQSFGPQTPHPEIVWSQSGGTNVWPDGTTASFDFTFQTQGNFTVDASKDPPQLAALLNAMCADAQGTSCSFTATGPPTFGPGDITALPAKANCPTTLRRQSRRPVRGTAEPPPDGDPDWYARSVEVSRTASISAGASITGSASANVIGLIATEVSAKFGVEHEWSNTSTFEKESRVYVPQGYIGGIWSAPVVGKITGTLVVSTSAATYTITNFQELKAGAQPDLTTPPVEIMTSARPMTQSELQANCPKLVAASRPARPASSAPRAGLGRAGRSWNGVKRGGAE